MFCFITYIDFYIFGTRIHDINNVSLQLLASGITETGLDSYRVPNVCKVTYTVQHSDEPEVQHTSPSSLNEVLNLCKRAIVGD